jgi:hypothetical protein
VNLPVAIGYDNHLFEPVLVDDSECVFVIPLKFGDYLHGVKLCVLLVKQTLEDGAVSPAPALAALVHAVDDEGLDVRVEGQVVRQARREDEV